MHLDLQISLRIFEKLRNDPNAIIRGLGEDDSRKKPEELNLVTLSLCSFPDLSGVTVHGDMEVKVSLVTEPEDERTERSLNRFIERDSALF